MTQLSNNGSAAPYERPPEQTSEPSSETPRTDKFYDDWSGSGWDAHEHSNELERELNQTVKQIDTLTRQLAEAKKLNQDAVHRIVSVVDNVPVMGNGLPDAVELIIKNRDTLKARVKWYAEKVALQHSMSLEQFVAGTIVHPVAGESQRAFFMEVRKDLDESTAGTENQQPTTIR